MEELILRALVLLFLISMEIFADAGNLQLHLANQDYQVCIKHQSGFCSIRWTPSTTITTVGTFAMTGAYIGQGAAVGVY